MISNNLIATASFTPCLLQSPSAWLGHLPFAAWVIQETSPKIFVELGTHYGHSYFAFCQSVVEAGISTKCYAVDTWQGDEHSGRYNDEIFAKVNAHHQEHYAGFSKLLRSTFDKGVTCFADESIELLHIDGLHTYEAVKHDFETWLPKLAPGAVVMFHDTNVRERDFGVWKLWEELQTRYPSNLEFLHSHGLGVLQLNNAPDEKKLDWLQPSSPEKQRLINYFAALGSRQMERFELSELKRQTVNLTQAVAERDGQITSLNQAVAERDGQITSLNQAVAERDGQIAQIYRSRSWKLTFPFRFVSYQIRRVFAAYRFGFALLRSFGGLLKLVKKIANVIHRDGLRGVVFRAKNTLRYYKATGGGGISHASLCARLEDLDLSIVAHGPTITVIMPVYNTPIDMLSAAIMSVRDQVYKNWELIIVDDKSTNPEVAKTVKQFAANDQRIKTYFRAENGNISKALNSGINLASGEFVAVLDHDDTIDHAALYWVARSILENPSADYIYTDEDKITKDGRVCYGPFFKPDWSPEYLLAMMYTCHLGVYRTSIIRGIDGYRTEYDGAQDFDLTLRFLNRTNNVIHIPRVLYHWRVWEQSTAQSLDAKPYAERRARKALEAFLDLRNESFVICDGPLPGHHQVKFLPKGEPLISIVIPTANGTIDINGKAERHIDAVTKGIFDKTKYTNYELIVVHNGNLLPEQEESFSGRTNLTLVHYNANKFSLSEKINLGCAHAKGEYLVIMNDDVRVISEDWLDQMTGMVQRDGVGVVGPKMLFPDETIQHAGVVLLGGLPGHAYYQWPKNSDGYALGLKVNRNYLAVTGACAITPKWLFDKVGGYSDRYPLNYNDVDYCLKLHRMGYRSVYLANVELYHYEGVSKEGGRSVSDSEIQKFLEDWGALYPNDPYYNPNLSQNAPYQF